MQTAATSGTAGTLALRTLTRGTGLAPRTGTLLPAIENKSTMGLHIAAICRAGHGQSTAERKIHTSATAGAMVRRRVFLRARRVVLRAHKRMRVRERLALTQARQIISYAGYFAHSDSGHFSKKYDFPAVIQAAKRVISKHDKQHANKI